MRFLRPILQGTKRNPLLSAFALVRINRIDAPLMVMPDGDQGNTCQREQRENGQRVDCQIGDDLQQHSQGYYDDGVCQHQGNRQPEWRGWVDLAFSPVIVEQLDRKSVV